MRRPHDARRAGSGWPEAGARIRRSGRRRAECRGGRLCAARRGPGRQTTARPAAGREQDVGTVRSRCCYTQQAGTAGQARPSTQARPSAAGAAGALTPKCRPSAWGTSSISMSRPSSCRREGPGGPAFTGGRRGIPTQTCMHMRCNERGRQAEASADRITHLDDQAFVQGQRVAHQRLQARLVGAARLEEHEPQPLHLPPQLLLVLLELPAGGA